MFRIWNIRYRCRSGIRIGRPWRIPHSNWDCMLNFDRPYKYSGGGRTGGGIAHTDSKPAVPFPGRAASFAGSGAEADNFSEDMVSDLN